MRLDVGECACVCLCRGVGGKMKCRSIECGWVGGWCCLVCGRGEKGGKKRVEEEVMEGQKS